MENGIPGRMDEPVKTGVFLRVDKDYTTPEDFKRFLLSDDYPKVLAMAHNGTNKENPHWHAIIQTELSVDTFRKRVKKEFPKLSGIKSYNLTYWDGKLVGAGSYMFHEKQEEIFLNKGYSEEELKEMRQANALIRTESSKVKYVSREEKAKSDNEILEAIAQQMASRYGDDMSQFNKLGSSFDTEFTVNSVIDYFNKHKIKAGYFKVRDFVQWIEMRYYTRSFKEKCLAMCLR